jgi:catechol 2,3-dioxygenase-like lactoylglutathione lyase family enzyme
MVRDVPRTIRFYEKLGFTLTGQDDPREPKYAVLQRDGVELHFQWHHAKEWDYPNDRPTYRFLVRDVDGLHRLFRESGEALDMKDVADAGVPPPRSGPERAAVLSGALSRRRRRLFIDGKTN